MVSNESGDFALSESAVHKFMFCKEKNVVKMSGNNGNFEIGEI